MILQHWFIVDQTFKVSIPEQHDSAPRIYNSKWLSWFHSCATDLCCSESSDFSCVMCGWMRSAFLLCCHGSMNLTNQHTSLWGSGKLWSSLILSTSTTAQAHGCKWYMSLTDAVAPCLLALTSDNNIQIEAVAQGFVCRHIIVPGHMQNYFSIFSTEKGPIYVGAGPLNWNGAHSNQKKKR